MKGEKLLREVFVEAAEIEDLAVRASYLDKVCAGDTVFRERVESLLAFDSQGKQTKVFEPASTIIEPEPGSLIGPYKLLERIGQGGCGVVYMAKQEKPVIRQVALKIIKLGMDTKQVIARFEAERQALAIMDHPSIAKVFDGGTTETGRPYFVMELVRGTRITEYCDQSTMGLKERLKLYVRVCQAVQHAHQKGIIHRDLKPSNILVTEVDSEPIPKIIDFGIAKAIERSLTEQTLFTAHEQLIGTPAYMSPEQANSNTADIDTRTDIYSLGVLLYEMLSGQTPFDGKALIESGVDRLRQTIQEKDPQKPSTRMSELSPDKGTSLARSRGIEPAKLISLVRGDLDWIVMRCLEKDRKRRYETANSLALDVERHLANEPIVARPASIGYRMFKTWNRHRLAVMFTLALVATLVIGTGVSIWQAREARKASINSGIERDRANLQMEKAQANELKAQRLLYASNMNLANQALERHDLAQARRLLEQHRPQPGVPDLRGWEWRYLWQESRYDPLTVLTNKEERGFSIDVSADGTLMAVGWYSGKIELWDTVNRRLLQQLGAPQTVERIALPAQVAFSPQGKFLATSNEGKIMLHDLVSGERSIMWKGQVDGITSIHDLAFSSDGSRLILYTEFEGENLWKMEALVIRIATKEIEIQLQTRCNYNIWFGSARLSPDNRRLYYSYSTGNAHAYQIRCHDILSDQELWTTEFVEDRDLSAMEVSPDGRFLVNGSGFFDGTVRVWNTETGELHKRLEGHSSWICDLDFSEDGKWLFSASTDQSIRLWDTSSWQGERTIFGQTDEVHACAYSQSLQSLVSVGRSGNLILWPMENSAQSTGDASLLFQNERAVQDLSFYTPYKLQTLSEDRSIDGSTLASDIGNDLIKDFALTENISSGPDWTCRWDREERMLVYALKGGELENVGVVNLPSISRPITAIYDSENESVAWVESGIPKTIYFQKLDSSKSRISMDHDLSGSISIEFSDQGNYLLGGNRKAVRVWHVPERSPVFSVDIDASYQRFGHAKLGEQSNQLVVVIQIRESNHEIRIYDLANLSAAPKRFPGRFICGDLAISPESQMAAASTQEGVVRLFHLNGDGWFKDFKAHRNSVSAVTFSPDGKRLISRGSSVKLWDVDTWQELLRLPLTKGSIHKGLYMSSDGHAIISNADVWRAPGLNDIDLLGVGFR